MYVIKLLIRLMTLLTLATVSSTQTSGTQLRRDSRLSKYPLQIHQMYRDQILKKPSKPMGEWSDWDSWSPCSRSCGGGITQQTRHCVNRPAESRLMKRRRGRRQSVRPIGGCVGLYKRVRLCNDKECPSRTDFRHEQCAAFNTKTFRGAIHQWEPFLKVKDECALNCRAIGMNFFATLNKTVIDGTPCLYPVTHTGKAAPRGTRGVCVGGYCKAVNSHGVVGSIDSEVHPPDEQCAACRRSTCRDINGIYTKPDLPPGYSLVAQIPAGACKIVVEQLKHTRNLLALKHTNGSFIVNGDWKFSNSRVFSGAGTKFVYFRPDENSLENLKSPGPLASPVDIMIVNYQANTGIKYSYSLPMEDAPVIAPPLIKRPNSADPSIIETRRLETTYNNVTLKDESRPQILHPGPRRTRIRRKHFHWKVTGLTACSKSCGGGIQTYVKTCIRDLGPHNQMPVHDRRCTHLESPTSAPIRCNTDPCPPSWDQQWTDCSVTCGDGVQQNIPQCKQDSSNGPVIVSESLCQRLPKPAVQSRPCRKPACESISDNELPRIEEKSWMVGNWSQCSVTCGTGHRTRSVICPSGHHCKAEHRPAHAEYCNMGPCSASFSSIASDSESRNSITSSSSSWLVTEWSQCSEACGTGHQTRLALCENEEETCSDSSKPEVSRACSSEKECGGQWFTGPWGKCSDSCPGRAKQKREVICIVKIRGQSHITNEMTCSAHLKPSEEQACEGSCPPHWFVGEWGQCEDSCPVGVQRREVKCLDSHGKRHNGCAVEDMPVSKRTCACPVKAATDSREKYKPAQDEPADRSCVDRIRKCKLAVQARLCHYPYYTTHCCESCRRAQDLFD